MTLFGRPRREDKDRQKVSTNVAKNLAAEVSDVTKAKGVGTPPSHHKDPNYKDKDSDRGRHDEQPSPAAIAGADRQQDQRRSERCKTKFKTNSESAASRRAEWHVYHATSRL